MTADMGPFAGMGFDMIQALTRYGTPPYRQMVRETVKIVDSSDYDELPTTIDGWIAWMEGVRSATQKKHRDGLRCVLKYKDGWNGDIGSSSLTAFYDRPETDSEMRRRVERGIAYVAQSEQRERQHFEALKLKFGA